MEGNDTTEGLLILIANPILAVSAEASAPQPPGSRTVQKTGWTQMSLEIMEAVTKIAHIWENAGLDLRSGLRARGGGLGFNDMKTVELRGPCDQLDMRVSTLVLDGCLGQTACLQEVLSQQY